MSNQRCVTVQDTLISDVEVLRKELWGHWGHTELVISTFPWDLWERGKEQEDSGRSHSVGILSSQNRKKPVGMWPLEDTKRDWNRDNLKYFPYLLKCSWDHLFWHIPPFEGLVDRCLIYQRWSNASHESENSGLSVCIMCLWAFQNECVSWKSLGVHATSFHHTHTHTQGSVSPRHIQQQSTDADRLILC